MVEDEVLIRMMISQELRAAGLYVIEASNAADALSLLHTIKVDVVFTDVRMPGQSDGLALARIVRSNWPRTKVVMASAHHHLPSPRHADLFFSKPYDLPRVVSAIRELSETNHE